MRIGCLQFAPKVGDINNNLNRADAVLSRAKDLEGLDLLVLPELAFTGYNFHSLSHISPFLEPSGSGISSLWARTTALKLNCNVVVGYPEKVDVTPKWPTSPEFYNSAIIIGKDGETIANYRKSFLYAVDETWALEGQDGFFEGYIPDLGDVAMGICMDINPYRFEAPWRAFEFAYHILDVQANLVIITMAWLTREDPGTFTQLPQDPDMETLQYWVQRLEPLIRDDFDEEIIVVCCNRAGMEEDCVYAGTSAVFGILHGEVSVYGMLGRGDKDVLVVDTKKRPYAKVVLSNGDETVVASDGAEPAGSASLGQLGEPAPAPKTEDAPSDTNGNSYERSKNSSSPPLMERDERDEEDTWDRVSTAASAGSSSRSVKSQTWLHPAVHSMPKLSLEIPDEAAPDNRGKKATNGTTDSPATGTKDIPTPTAPSLTPMDVRPVVSSSGTHVPLPAGNALHSLGGGSFVKIKSAPTPLTPPLAHSSKRRPGMTPTPVSEAPPSPPTDMDLGLVNGPQNLTGQTWNVAALGEPPRQAKKPDTTPAMAASPANDMGADFNYDQMYISSDEEEDTASQKQRKAAARVQQELHHLIQATQQQPSSSPPPVLPRPASTKSRNASLPRLSESVGSMSEFSRSISPGRMVSIPVTAGADVPPERKPGARRSESPIYFRPDSSFGSRRLSDASHRRHTSETRDEQQLSRPSGRQADVSESTSPWPTTSTTRRRHSSAASPVSRGRQPFLQGETTGHSMPNTQQPTPAGTNFAVDDVGTGPSATASRGAAGSQERGRKLSASRRLGLSNERPVPSASATSTRATSASAASSVSWLFGTPPPPSSSSSGAHPTTIDPDDEIVAMINLISRECPVHSHSRQPSSGPSSQGQRGQQTLVQQLSPQQRDESTGPNGASPNEPEHPHPHQHRHHQHHDEHPPTGTSRPSTNQRPVPLQLSVDNNNIYEVILPPHIRELIESLSSAEPLPPRRRNTSTPKFNPPTPTAMQFDGSGSGSGSIDGGGGSENGATVSPAAIDVEQVC